MKFYPMHMHLHSAHEPSASIGAHMSHAAELGIKHLWLTEHDVRMGEKQKPIPYFRFSTPELFARHINGLTCGFKHIKEEKGSYTFSEKDGMISLDVSTEAGGYEEFYFYSDVKAHSDPLFAEIAVDVDADVRLSDGARFAVEFILSEQPPSYKHVKMIYNMGALPEKIHGNSALYPFPERSADGLYHFDLTGDVTPEIGGLDNALCYINLIIEGEGSFSFRGFKFNRVLNYEDVRKRQMEIADALGKKWGVTPFVTFEISGAGHHRNCYTTAVPCINYKERNFKVTGEEAIAHVKEHGGIFCYNHPFTEWKHSKLSEEEKQGVVDELIEKFSENRVEGATLMEVGFPYIKEDFYDRHYLRLHDGLSSRGVFITSDGDSDNHGASDTGWIKGNNFVTFAGLYYNEEPREGDFINAFKRGSCWCGNPVLIKKMWLSANRKFTFGTIFVNEDVEIDFGAAGISSEGYALRIVNGRTDARLEIEGGEVRDSFTLKSSERFNFVRYELRDQEGILIALSNPVYLLQNEDDIYPEAEIRRADYKDYKKQVETYERALEDGKSFFAGASGTRLLHIGDTRAEHYEYYARMIEEFKPDVIIHTGDLADEMKAGRIDADRTLWRENVPKIIETMRRSGARCIIVPGNNDLQDSLYSIAPDMEILPRNSVIEIGGKRICLNHEVMKLDETLDVDIHLYGHGFTGDSRTAEDNVRDGKKYFNTTWGSSLHIPEEDKDLIISEIRI